MIIPDEQDTLTLLLAQSVWQALVGTVEVYESAVVFAVVPDEYVVDPADDMDGDRISVEALAFELIECVREVRSPTLPGV